MAASRHRLTPTRSRTWRNAEPMSSTTAPYEYFRIRVACVQCTLCRRHYPHDRPDGSPSSAFADTLTRQQLMSGMDPGLAAAWQNAVRDHLDHVDRLVLAADVVSRAALAASDIPRLTATLRAVLDAHLPD